MTREESATAFRSLPPRVAACMSARELFEAYDRYVSVKIVKHQGGKASYSVRTVILCTNELDGLWRCF